MKTIRYSAAQVQQMLQIGTRTIPETDSLAEQAGIDPWSLEAMARGEEHISGAVLKVLDLEPRGNGYVWRLP